MAFHLDDGSDDRHMADINVTPLVDVMLVLLIIFMVTAPMLHQGMEVNLPQTAKAEEIPLRVDDPLVLTVRTDGLVWIRDQSVHPSRLLETLAPILATRDENQVYIKGDKNITYGQFIEVIGLLHAGNITNIGLVAEEISGDPS